MKFYKKFAPKLIIAYIVSCIFCNYKSLYFNMVIFISDYHS